MDRIKKTAGELEAIVRVAASELKNVKFRVVPNKSSGGWTTVMIGRRSNHADIEYRLKQIVSTLVGLYELQR